MLSPQGVFLSEVVEQVSLYRQRKSGDKVDKQGSNNEPLNKVVGHHRGWANRNTELAVDSDFTAGYSYTRRGAKKESVPRVEEFQMSPSLREIRKKAKKGFRFILPDETYDFRFWGSGILTESEAKGKKFPGVTAGLYSDRMSWESDLELQVPKEFEGLIVEDVGVLKRALPDYLDIFQQENEIFKWAKSKTIGYENFSDLMTSPEKMLEWQKKHGQSIENAVFKIEGTSASKGVYLGGLESVPKELFSSKDLLVQPRYQVLEEYRVVVAGGKAVDTTYRWGKGAQGKAPGKAAKLYQGIGIESGKPELIQHVWGEERGLLEAFAEKYHRSLPYGVGALDIIRTGHGVEDFMVVEAQKKFGNIANPWVRQKIEYALTGRWPKEWKAGAALALAAVGAGILRDHLKNKEEKQVSNNVPYNKIHGHHFGWANKNTEAAIDSDFVAGRSLALEKVWARAGKVLSNNVEKNVGKILSNEIDKNELLIKKFSGIMKKYEETTSSLAKELGAKEWDKKEVESLIRSTVKWGKEKHPDSIEYMWEQLGKALSVGFTAPLEGIEGTLENEILKQGLLKPGQIGYSSIHSEELFSQVLPKDVKFTQEFGERLTKNILIHEGFEKETVDVFGKSKAFATHYSEDILWAESYHFGRTGQKDMFSIFQDIRESDFAQARAQFSKLKINLDEDAYRMKYVDFYRAGAEDSAKFLEKSELDKAYWGLYREEKLHISMDKPYEKVVGGYEAGVAQNNLRVAFRKTLSDNPTVGMTNQVLHENRTNHQVMDIHEKTKHLFKI